MNRIEFFKKLGALMSCIGLPGIAAALPIPAKVSKPDPMAQILARATAKQVVHDVKRGPPWNCRCLEPWQRMEVLKLFK